MLRSCVARREPYTAAEEFETPCELRWQQLRLAFRQGVRENFMKAHGVRVRRKVKNHWFRSTLFSTIACAPSVATLTSVLSELQHPLE